jgi:hypothetical protein
MTKHVVKDLICGKTRSQHNKELTTGSPSTLAHIFHPGYSEGRDREDCRDSYHTQKSTENGLKA